MRKQQYIRIVIMFHHLVGDIAYPKRKYVDAAQAPGCRLSFPQKSPPCIGVKSRKCLKCVPVTAGAFLFSLEDTVILNHGYLTMLALLLKPDDIVFHLSSNAQADSRVTVVVIR